MYTAYKVEIYPTDDQKAFIKRTIGLYRYVYNWGLIQCRERYKQGEKSISRFTLHGLLTSGRKESDVLSMVPVSIARCAMDDLHQAYMAFFRKKARYPRFKTKKHASKCFRTNGDPTALYFKGNFIKLPGVPGLIDCGNHNIPQSDRYYTPIVSFDGYRYWLSISIKYDPTPDISLLSDESIGIDLGFRKTMQLSNGMSYKYPDIHVLERRRRKLQRNLDKRRVARVKESIRTKTKYEDLPISKNEERVRFQFYKTQQRINNIRNSFVQQSTTEIVNLYPKRIVVEDLNIIGILNIAAMRKLHDGVAFTKILNCLEYKCANRGIEFVKAPRFFASTQICSRCGKKHRPNSDEVYNCPYCGLTIDRDLNAAINLSRV